MNILQNSSIILYPVFVNGNSYYADVVSCTGWILYETDPFPTRGEALQAAEEWISSIQTDEEEEMAA